MGAWASPSWAACAQRLSLRLGLEQQSLHRLVQHVEVLVGDTTCEETGTPESYLLPPPPEPSAAAYLDGSVCHAEVRPNAHGKQQVKDGWLNPEG